ncbi:Uncharacterized protein dnl_58310 [Desulfonema limicola]|uniref:Uncharacterized protein n=1 Tax=Desulfonema limicola TaxID=45656 RepID=A0A975BDZ4_9BACT|nr:Uncharacterized protein dnl_58310 [Desulfonema limicola]
MVKMLGNDFFLYSIGDFVYHNKITEIQILIQQVMLKK